MKNIFLTLSVLALVACGPKRESRRSQAEMVQYFIKGDPVALIANTVQDKKSFLNGENIDSFGDYAVSGLILFTNKDQMVQKTEPGNIEEGNEATNENLTETPKIIYKFKRVSESEVILENKSSLIKNFKFLLSSNGDFELTSFNIQESEVKATPLHYSISEDKSKMSFLMNTEINKGQKSLMAISFYLKKPRKKEVRKVDTKYSYIYGPGVIVPWKLDDKREIKVNVCSPKIRDLDFSDVVKNLEYWEGYSYPQNFEIVVNRKTDCRPFSDVNESNIFYIKDYLTTPPSISINPGVALVNADLYQDEIFDADIFIFGSEIDKAYYFSDYDMGKVLIHEFGHFLGLHHKFGGPDSIMSYDDDIYLPLQYDREAVLHLYPVPETREYDLPLPIPEAPPLDVPTLSDNQE